MGIARTVALVRAHRAIRPHRTTRGHFLKGHAVRSRPLPRQVPPRLTESDYAASIIAIMNAAKGALAPLLAELAELLEQARVSRGDAADHIIERRKVLGLDVAVEYLRGTERPIGDGDETATMVADYGFIEGVIGPDGEEVDVYLGPVNDPPWIYVIHQTRPDSGEYDEDKVMIGWESADDAASAYVDQYNDDIDAPVFFGGMSVLSAADFVAMLEPEVGMLTNRMDSGESLRAMRLLERARAEMDRRMNAGALEALATRYATATSVHSREQLKRQTKAALGVDIAASDKNVPAITSHFVGENVQLIKSLGNRTFDDLGKMVTSAFTSGTRHEDLAKKIEERFNVGERHARLIARDQIGKLNGQVNASRQQELGVTAFIWRTVNDERVREEHQALEGQQFDYDDPPADEGLPGEPINCRCYAEPVFSTIDEGLTSSSTDDAVQPGDDEESMAASNAFDDGEDVPTFTSSRAPVDDTQEEAIAVTPKTGESAAQFQARMARNEASRLQKMAARAAARAQVAAIAAGPTPPITIAPPLVAAPPPAPTLPPSSAPIATRAVATSPKPGETPGQHAARLARNEASRVQKAAARAATRGQAPPVVMPPAAPPAAPAPALPPPPVTTHIARPVIAPPNPPIPPAPVPAARAAAPRPGETPGQHAARLARNEASRLQKAAKRAAGRGAFAPGPVPTVAAPIAPPAPPAPTQVAPPNARAPRPVQSIGLAPREQALGLDIRPALMRGAPQLDQARARELAANFGTVGKDAVVGKRWNGRSYDQVGQVGRISPTQQKGLREHLRSSIENYGLHRADPDTKASNGLSIKSNYRARGTHSNDGKIVINAEVAMNAGRFARDQAAGINYAEAIRRGDPMAHEYKIRANDYRTHVHEQLHGYGPRGLYSRSYSGVGVMVEEVATEVSARKMVRDQLGLHHDDVEQLGRPSTKYSPGSYSEYIKNTEDAVTDALMSEHSIRIDESSAYKHVEEAALRYKSLAEHPDAQRPESSADLFGRSFDFASIESSTGRKFSDEERGKLAAKISQNMKRRR